MFIDSFFKITHIETIVPQHYRFVIALDTEHGIFKGHFPDNPVMPGVCFLQMIIDCVGIIVKYPVKIYYLSVIKFLGIVRPSFDKELEIDFYLNEELLLKATVKSFERTVMSCKMNLKKI